MTKPSCSKNETNETTTEDLENDAEISERNSRGTTPTSAKDFFADFAPEGSESSEENEPLGEKKDENYEPPSKKSKESSSPKKYSPKYKKDWENKPELKPWLSESIHGSTFFYCRFCEKDYRCGISDIYKHMSSKKHALKATTPTCGAQRFKFRGLLCPAFTPFVPNRRTTPDVNLKAISKYANFLAACGLKGILINDIVGEGMSLTIRERIDVTDAWADICEKTKQFLMVQIGGAPLKDVIEMAKHAQKRGVGAIVILPDVYNKPRNHLDLIRYIKLISEFTKKVPLLYHHHPKVTNVEIDVPSLLLDIIGEVSSFAGIIYSTNDIQQSTAAAAIDKEKFTIIMGTDEGILAAAATGRTSFMGSSLNFLPKLVQAICDGVKNENLKSAQTSQDLLNRTIEAILKQGDSIAALKAATELMTGTCGRATREPLQALWEGTVQQMKTKLRELRVM